MGDLEKAESSYRESLDVARRQDAKGWELRTATDLARLWMQQGKRREGLELLTPVYGRFTDGFDSRDLIEARELLTDLA